MFGTFLTSALKALFSSLFSAIGSVLKTLLLIKTGEDKQKLADDEAALKNAQEANRINQKIDSISDDKLKELLTKND